MLGLAWLLRQQRICLQGRRPRFNPWIRRILWRREWLPGEFHGQRSLVGYSTWRMQRVKHDWATNTYKLKSNTILFSRAYNTEWIKSEKQVSFINTYMESRKFPVMNLQSKNREADIERRLVDIAGKERVGQIERVALKHMHYHI